MCARRDGQYETALKSESRMVSLSVNTCLATGPILRWHRVHTGSFAPFNIDNSLQRLATCSDGRRGVQGVTGRGGQTVGSPMDDLKVLHRIDAVLHVNDFCILKGSQHMDDSVHCLDVGKESIAEALSLGSTPAP